MKTAIDKNESEIDRKKREAIEWLDLDRNATAPSFIRIAINAFSSSLPPQPGRGAEEILTDKMQHYFSIRHNNEIIRAVALNNMSRELYWQYILDAMEEYHNQPEGKDMWIETAKQLPSENDCYELLGFNKEWIDEDFNPFGIRPCVYFINHWVIARWNATQDEWATDWTEDEDCKSNPPTHWMPLPEPPKSLVK